VLKVGTTASVVTITCQSNEVIVNNTCQCDQNSIKNNNKCIQCPPATFKASNTQCALCSSYCASCQSNTTCQECHLGFQFNGSVCAEVCGDGKKYILPCDDGNTVNGDGCSSTCLIETGYVCNGGNENHADTCTKLKPNAKISISIGANSPTYVSAGIFTDFILQPPIERTREELHNLFMISFSNP
jgi:cysteine-rich repeat protein